MTTGLPDALLSTLGQRVEASPRETAGGRLELRLLNLRGTRFTVPLDAADAFPSSRLYTILRNPSDRDCDRDQLGAVFVNRNPLHFHTVLDIAAGGTSLLQELLHSADASWEKGSLMRELSFWGLGTDDVVLKRPRLSTAESDAVDDAAVQPTQQRYQPERVGE